MAKLSYIVKYFQIDVEKLFVNFHCRTIRFCKAYTGLLFDYDISALMNAI